MMRLVNVRREPLAVNVLYDLLKERPVNSRISHHWMPSWNDHLKFFRSRPYRYWYLVKVGKDYVGDLHVTHLNEIGIFLFERFRGNGYGANAVQLFMSRHRPLCAIPARRVNRWLAHIAPENGAARIFFDNLGFVKVQETWAL